MNSHQTKLLVLAIILLTIVSFLAGGCSPAIPTQPPPTPTLEPLNLVKIYEQTFIKIYELAFNRHDVDATMDLLSENVSIDLVGWPDQAHSRQEARDLEEFWFAMNVEFHYIDCNATGSSVSCKAVAIDDCSKHAGMNGINFSTASFEFSNGKINSIRLQMRADDENTYQNFLNNMELWATKVYPDDLKKTNVYNRETGAIFSSLCNKYDAIPIRMP